jgi:hypothetical protein
MHPVCAGIRLAGGEWAPRLNWQSSPPFKHTCENGTDESGEFVPPPKMKNCSIVWPRECRFQGRTKRLPDGPINSRNRATNTVIEIALL